MTTARAADIAELTALLAELFEAEAEFEPDGDRQARGLRRIIDDDGVGAVLVARDGARIDGMVTLLYTVSTALGARVALLEDLVVRAGQRRAGTGAALLAAARSTARAAGCARITLLTDADNAAAQRFYARHGFSRSLMVPYRTLL